MPELCDSIVALKRQTNREKAQELLERLHKFSLPLMRKHNLRITTLTEFFPKDPRLLGININHGQKIAIRLRFANNPNRFINFSDLLGTMLHELTHNRHGPHNEQFFAYLDRLKGEMQTLLNKGFKGDLWLGQGTRLGGLARPAGAYARPAPAAAGIGRGRRLGGRNISLLGVADRRQRALDAAEYRRQIDLGCPSNTPLTEIEIIDMTRDESPTPQARSESPHPDPQSSPTDSLEHANATPAPPQPQRPPRQQRIFIDLT